MVKLSWMSVFSGKGNSIGGKLRLALMPPFVLAALLMAGLFSFLTYTDLETELETKQKTLADIYATALSDAVWNLDQSGAEAILAALSLDPDVAGAVVKEQFSGVLATVGRALPQDKRTPLLVTRAIRSDADVGGETIGEVAILFHKERLEVLLQDSVIQILGLLLLLMLVLSVSVTGAIRRFVSEPLETLLRGIKRTEEKHSREPIGWESDDEFGIVIQAYNGMIRRLSDEEEALIFAKNTAEKANKAKSSFLATMSHELRTPLNGITGMAQLMEDTGLDDRQRNYLHSLRSSGDVLLSLVNDILDFSKIEAGALEIDHHAFSLYNAVQTVEQLIRPQARAKNIQTNLTVDVERDDYFWGDGSKLTQVLTNLAGNAVKFTDEGEVSISVRALETTQDDALLHFEVKDTGIGIPQEQIENLFSAFTQVDTSISRRFGGTGLGLAISAGLVEAMGGDRIHLESEIGQGTRFYFELRLPRARAPAHVCAPAQQGVPGRELMILVVEDNKINRTVAKGLLEKMGHIVSLANDGQEGVEAVQENDFDLVLMDIHMPRLNGLEATEQIRQMVDVEKATIPILALTADVMQDSIEEYSKYGMQGYVAKPVRREALAEALAPYTLGSEIGPYI
jgi:signal transduction histidine kinase/ActR/RegA family two-component response regulator